MSPTPIMIVDDDPAARFLMRTILGDHPEEFEIVAETGRATEAVGLLDDCAPEVVLLDARMPVTDGFELAAQLLEARPGLRIALLSAVVDDEVRGRARAAGIHACLDKAAFADVPQVVRDLVSQEPGATAARG